MPALITERELQFLLYEFLDTEHLFKRARYADHSREVFDATLEAARRLANDAFSPHYAKGDHYEPAFDAGTVRVLPEVAAAWTAFAEAGFLNSHWDAGEGGLQLPEVVLRAALGLFFAANTPTAAYPFLTIGAGNLLRAFGSEALKRRFLASLADGSAAGTMALTEPNQGSALGDIRTSAIPQVDGTYRVRGQKMFISGGDQDFTRNILHMVLARIEGAPAGAKGISLFLVPKHLVDEHGQSSSRNDVALAGLLHKMGWRQTTSTVLSFGENGGAIAYLLGEPNRGLDHMFQMMNESRIGVGLMAACLAYSGFAESLAYARERRQGRLPSAKDTRSPQVRLVDHADVRRMLLAQKAFAEGALAMCLFASSVFEDQNTHPNAEERSRAALLLHVLTPVVKSWSSRYGCVANDLAMQVLGGAGYTREYPLEQLYRDQRLNPIHEGAEGIHGLDLLGRKVTMRGGAAFECFCESVCGELDRSSAHANLRDWVDALRQALDRLRAVTAVLTAARRQDLDLALANATVYLDVLGRVTAAWMWLRQARTAQRALEGSTDGTRHDHYRGKLQAAGYFFKWELPTAASQFDLLERPDRGPFDMQDAWYQ